MQNVLVELLLAPNVTTNHSQQSSPTYTVETTTNLGKLPGVPL